jgi:hypothetical protein
LGGAQPAELGAIIDEPVRSRYKARLITTPMTIRGERFASAINQGASAIEPLPRPIQISR